MKKVTVIAEIGSNHNGCLATALELIDVSAGCGADIVKFQGFLADELISLNDSRYDIMKRLEVPRDWYPDLMDRCKKNNVGFLSTATNFTTLQWMLDLGVTAFKVASCNLTYRQMIDKLIEIGLPIIVSTGLATIDEIVKLAAYFEAKGFDKYSFLHCVSKYPVQPSDLRLKNILVLKEILNCPVGFSDHTHGYHLAVAAVALGARIVEKHISLDKKGIGLDHDAAVLPGVFKDMCSAIRDTEKALFADFSPDAGQIFELRRSLHFKRDLVKGEFLKDSDIKVVRPEDGLLPEEMDRVIGRKLSHAVCEGQAVTNECFEP